MQVSTNTIKMLNTSVKTIFQTAFDGVESEWSKIAMEVPSSNTSNTYPWLGSTFGIREWLGDRVIQNLKTYDYTIKNKSFEGTIGIDRDDIEDDNLGIYTPVIQNLAATAKHHPDELIFGLLKSGTSALCYDKKPFFSDKHVVGEGKKAETVSNYQAGEGEAWYLLDTSRPVKPMIWQKRKDYKIVSKTDEADDNVFMKKQYLYGVDGRGNAGYGFWQMAYCSKAELTQENIEAAYAAMCSVKGDNGKPLGVKPTLLVVPPSLRSKAKSLVEADKLANGQDNPNKNLVKVLDTAWLA